MDNLTFQDYLDRISMRELLEHADYHFYRKDGLKYPAYVRLDNDGKRIKGDKFIVTANGKGCFRPPEQNVYNAISFITEHPYYFSEYSPGMNLHHLVNEVCCKILGRTNELVPREILESRDDVKFDLNDYDIVRYDREDKQNQYQFYPYFKDRGIDKITQISFADSIMLSTNLRRQDGQRFQNIAFPMTTPDKGDIVGLEVRSTKHKDGTSFKGKALGTDSVHGMWIASPAGTPLSKAERVLWFESAYDAMAYYQIQRKSIREDKEFAQKRVESGECSEAEGVKEQKHLNWLLQRLNRSVYISTGGSPSEKQFKGVFEAAPEADHLLCFDRDKAGNLYSCNFLLQKNGRYFNSYTLDNGLSVFIDRTEGHNDRYEFESRNLNLEDFASRLGLDTKGVFRMSPSEGYKDWNDQLLDKRMEEEEQTDLCQSESEEDNIGKGMSL